MTEICNEKCESCEQRKPDVRYHEGPGVMLCKACLRGLAEPDEPRKRFRGAVHKGVKG